ncbi:MAG: cobalamin biosynthesis protein CobD [Desulfovibrio sp.]|nr:cobalamin biosynthesis protein CobD [Desulfovibrio sp.]
MKTLVLTLLSLPVLATVLDLLLGDPHRLPHPVRLIGRWLDWLERHAREWVLGLKGSGALCVVLTAGGAWAVVEFLTGLRYLGMILTLYFAYAGLALGELLDEGRDALELIEEGSLDEAREAVGGLVSRDTSGLDEAELRKTLAETLSENLCDGFVAPAFYLILGGPALLWAYKAVSTMDSMWGYRTERYQDLGWAAARADDLLAYVPARLTALFLLLAGAVLRLPWLEALRRVPAEARTMDSPNAGWPMSTCAWLLQAGMGGPAIYFGEAKIKPELGPKGQEWSIEKLKKLFRLMVFAAFLGLFVLQAVKVLLTA